MTKTCLTVTEHENFLQECKICLDSFQVLSHPYCFNFAVTVRLGRVCDEIFEQETEDDPPV